MVGPGECVTANYQNEMWLLVSNCGNKAQACCLANPPSAWESPPPPPCPAEATACPEVPGGLGVCSTPTPGPGAQLGLAPPSAAPGRHMMPAGVMNSGTCRPQGEVPGWARPGGPALTERKQERKPEDGSPRNSLRGARGPRCPPRYLPHGTRLTTHQALHTREAGADLLRARAASRWGERVARRRDAVALTSPHLPREGCCWAAFSRGSISERAGPGRGRCGWARSLVLEERMARAVCLWAPVCVMSVHTRVRMCSHAHACGHVCVRGPAFSVYVCGESGETCLGAEPSRTRPWLGLAVWPTHVSQMEPGAHRKENRCQKACASRWGRGRRLPLTHTRGLFPMTRPTGAETAACGSWNLRAAAQSPMCSSGPVGLCPLPRGRQRPLPQPPGPAVSMLPQGL